MSTKVAEKASYHSRPYDRVVEGAFDGDQVDNKQSRGLSGSLWSSALRYGRQET